MDASLDGVLTVFCDLDGTLYIGDRLIPGALEFLERCEARGIRRFFLSNNSSRSVDQYVERLQGLGVVVTADDILLSTHDLIAYLREAGHDRMFLLGTAGMRSMLLSAGFTLVEDEPEVLVLGYDTEMTYQRLAAATTHLHAGVPLIASHPDIVCPAPGGGLPDVGAFLALIEATTGVRPVHVCGKPSPSMILHRMSSLRVAPDSCAMIGDRLYTDVAMAKAAGVRSVLVLTGESTVLDVEVLPAEERPDLIVESVADLM